MVYSYYSKNDIQLDFNHFSTITQSSPREDLSNKYSFISTSRVLETLGNLQISKRHQLSMVIIKDSRNT